MKENKAKEARRILVEGWGCAILSGTATILGLVFPGSLWEVRMCLCVAAAAVAIAELLRQLFSKEYHAQTALYFVYLLCFSCVTLFMTSLSGAAQYVVVEF